MNILVEVGQELLKMFLGDLWLSLSVLVVVAIVALVIGVGLVSPVVGGFVLLASMVAILVGVVLAESRN